MCQVDVRIPHPEHRFTQDIDLWSKHHSSLFTTLTKPLLDIIVISRVLLRDMGPLGPLIIVSWYLLSGILMKWASPDFATIATTEQKLEADYRACHTSVVNHAEEIAFYRSVLLFYWGSDMIQSCRWRLEHSNQSQVVNPFTWDFLAFMVITVPGEIRTNLLFYKQHSNVLFVIWKSQCWSQ